METPLQSKYIFPKLYDAQAAAIDCKERYSVIEASTKSGKTYGCIIWLLEQANNHYILETYESTEKGTIGLCSCNTGGTGCQDGKIYWWVAPVFAQSMLAYNRAKRLLGQTYAKANDSDLSILFENGAEIQFKSGEKPDNLYGEDVWSVVIDEATRMREEAWIAIRTTISATNGPVRIIGNVKGRNNWAYRLARMAESGEDPEWHYSRITAQDAIIAGILSVEEVAAARQVMPERVWSELFEAIPSEDGGNPFGLDFIDACITESLSPNEPVAYGIDLAKSQDYTVCIGLDEDGNVCRFDRFQRDWNMTERFIIDEVGDVATLVDSTGVGDPIVERMRTAHPNIEGLKFTATSKQQLMENLAVEIQKTTIGFPRNEIVLELREFGYELTRNGTRYEAMAGHDDCVVALALAAWQKNDIPGWGVW
jgi:phage FluMu gp28-like protein